ncbi:MAG: NUDIX domain-containing protein [Patescibacteria group bacterium]
MPHIHDLIDFTVVAYIVYGEKVLMIHHKKLSKWLPIGGHIELDEDPDEALFREVKEECGLEVEVSGKKSPYHILGKKYLFPPEYMDIHQINENHRHISMVYFAKANSDKFVLAAKEHHAIRWFTDQELDDPQYAIDPDLRFYAREALKKFGNKW